MKFFFLFISSILLSPIANSQAMYKCGNSYSQFPCGSNSVKIGKDEEPSNPKGDPSKVEFLKKECLNWVTNIPLWKDKDSLKFGSVNRGKQETRTVKGRSQLVWPYYVMVNSKNSFGAYGGERVHVCYANNQETELIDLYKAGDL